MQSDHLTCNPPDGMAISTESTFSLPRLCEDARDGLLFYYGTSLAVLFGLFFGTAFVRPRDARENVGPDDFLNACIRFDGKHYLEIARNGYEYDRAERSNVAFFPAYPLLARAVAALTGTGLEQSLLVASNACLAAAFVLLAVYSRVRSAAVDAGGRAWTLLAFGFLPSTFFFRMPYSESLFLGCALLALIGMTRRWNELAVAAIAGLATATRPVGVAVSAAFLWHVLTRGRGTVRGRLGRAALLIPLSCWGLLAYMLFQAMAFDNPFAFAQTQVHWTYQLPPGLHTTTDKIVALLTLEPIWGVYDPNSARYWLRDGAGIDASFVAFNISFWNPILFVATVGLLVYGACRKMLDGPELVLGSGLLAIPYLTRGYEMSMASHARFAAAVVVAYPVAGRLLAQLHPTVAGMVLGIAAVILACWAAMFAAGYYLF